MYRRQLTLYLSTLLVLGITTVYYLVFDPIFKIDPELYSSFSNHKVIAQTDRKLESRKGITKDIWIRKIAGDTHHQIKAPSSILSTSNEMNEVEIVEDFNLPKIWFMEGDSLRYLAAKEGTFLHTKNLIISKDAVFSMLEKPKHPFLLPKEHGPFQAKASEVTCSLNPKSPSFSAKEVEATLLSGDAL